MTQKATVEFAYESDANASFLVIQGNFRTLGYQVSMLENNRISNVIPVDVVKRDGVTYLYYNITSKIPLSLILNIKKLNRNDLLKLLLKIASVVEDSSGYLLTSSNFIFNPDYVFLDPEVLEPALVYVPAVLGGAADGVEFSAPLPEFVSELVIKHINIAGFENSNTVQRILATVKNETFNIKGFIALLTELLYGQEERVDFTLPEINLALPDAKRALQETNRKVAGEDRGRSRGHGKEIEAKARSGSERGIIAAIAVIVQVIIACAIYLSRDFLNNVGDNPTTTYVAVAIIVLALEVLLFKKLNEAKLINIFGVQEGQETKETIKQVILPEQDRKFDLASISVKNEALMKKMTEKQTDPANPASQAPTAQQEDLAEPRNQAHAPVLLSGKTELLGVRKKGVRMLKSDGRHGNMEDILIDKDDFIIGRLKGYVDYELRNSAVGKLHAQLVYRNGKSYVKDLNSVNGTFINNVRLESNKEYELKENDRLQLANYEYIYLC